MGDSNKILTQNSVMGQKMREEGGLEECLPTTTYSKRISQSVNDLIVVQLRRPEKNNRISNTAPKQLLKNFANYKPELAKKCRDLFFKKMFKYQYMS